MTPTDPMALADELDAIFDRIEISCDWRLSSEERQSIAASANALRRPAAPHREALDNSQSLLTMILLLGEHDGVPHRISAPDWREEKLSKLILDQIVENRAALSQPAQPKEDRGAGELHEDAQGFHYVVNGERVIASPPLSEPAKTVGREEMAKAQKVLIHLQTAWIQHNGVAAINSDDLKSLEDVLFATPSPTLARPGALDQSRQRLGHSDATTRPPASAAKGLSAETDTVEEVARIIDPELFKEYDLLVAKGVTYAENGKPWHEVVFGKRIEALHVKARAILVVLPAPDGERSGEGK